VQRHRIFFYTAVGLCRGYNSHDGTRLGTLKNPIPDCNVFATRAYFRSIGKDLDGL
jgi:hypothetical protein